MNVTDIVARTKIVQSVVSQTLRKFRRVDLVTAHRNGKWIIYSINPERFEQIAKTCAALAEVYDGVKLGRKDKVYMERVMA